MAARRRAAAQPPPYFDDATPSSRAPVAVVIIVVLVAFGGFVWNIYGGREAAHIAPPPGAYKIAAPPDLSNAADPVEQNAMFESLEGQQEAKAVTPRPGPETPIEDTPAAPFAPPPPAVAPVYVDRGAFVAQVAALQSQEAAEAAWARLSSRAPELFAPAHLDVERADLGQRGVYYRVRAGYFADRENAVRFCDRIKRMGQDCLVALR